MTGRTIFEELKSTLVEQGEWKAYKIVLNKWRKGVKKISQGVYISIERHFARPSSLNKEEKAWFLSQRLTISDKDTLDKLIDELMQYSKELEKTKLEMSDMNTEDDDDQEILTPPHLK